ncbi:acetate kinase [Bryocella elongata]|uniref:Acetate kinase n=1 Tax=Bryocella elongata TaxID=863522 RepID=A0A1H5YEU4_9BACT|nr:acetate kinase [Bryocella elongata]
MKFSLYDRLPALEFILEGEVSGVGGDATIEILARGGSGLGMRREPAKAGSLYDALALVFDHLSGPMVPEIEAIGYRVVHPGPHLQGHQRITASVLKELEAATPFAPLHDPPARQLIQLGMQRYARVPQFACFDTVFHQTMPPEASTYALPEAVRAQGVRRYGFHGLSCESIVAQLEVYGGVPKRMVIAHLGSGCSVTTVLDGKSIDTTMGLTPTGGVVMGTRPGDVDPGLMLYLERHAVEDHETDPASAVEYMLNHNAGIVALSGQPNDLRKVRWAAAGGDAKAQLALAVFVHSVKKAVGAACFVLGGLDALVFTGGIGEHDAATRAEVVAGLGALGIALDSQKNEAPETGQGGTVRDITASNGATGKTIAGAASMLVLPAQEDWVIARHVDRMLHEAT